MNPAEIPPDQNAEAPVDRRAPSDRRQNDRRKKNIPVAFDRRKTPDRRQGERRRQVDPTTCERDYNHDEVEFMRAMDMYKRLNRRPFPTWSEVLEIVRALGYRKVEPPTCIPGTNVHFDTIGDDPNSRNGNTQPPQA
jgi:hypothetical protein